MDSLKQLKELALEDSRKRHPTLPEAARATRNYKVKTANGLTMACIDWIRFHGGQAERISVTGRYVDGSRIVSDVLGRTMRIGSGKWIPGSMQPGSADISSIIRGKDGTIYSVKAEIKIGRDRMSEAQMKYKEQVERAGGLYWLIHTWDEIINLYEAL